MKSIRLFQMFFLVSILMSSSILHANSTDIAVHYSESKNITSLYEFVSSKPTAREFQNNFPDIWLVLPGDMVDRASCSPYYRFMATINEEGRITGGLLE